MQLSTVSAIALLAAAGAAHAQTYIPLGTSSGTVAVHYNNGGPETPLNQRYYRAQNSAANTNGATFNFDSAFDLLPGIPGTQSMASIFQAVPDQFGFDLVFAAPTFDAGDVSPVPTLTAFDNGNNDLSGRIAAGTIDWAISGYTGGTDGPANPANGVINSLFRADSVNPGSIDFQNVTPIPGGFSVDVGGFLNTDNIIHWYTIGQADSSIPVFFNDGANFASGRIRFSGTLNYLIADDTTAGIDYYTSAGPMSFELELVPAPGAAALLGLGGLVAARRRRN